MEALFKKMEKLAKRYVKYPLCETLLDKNILEEKNDARNNQCERYAYWIIRACGTDIVFKSHVSYSTIFEYYMNDVEIDTMK